MGAEPGIPDYLAALALVNRRELSRHRATRSWLVVWTRVMAQNLAFVGVVAGFWHISWIAGTGMLVSGLVAVAVHAAGYMDLRRDETPTPRSVADLLSSANAAVASPDG